MTTNLQLSTTKPKKNPETKPKRTKETTRMGTDHRNRDHMEGYQWGRMEGNVQGIRSINGRYKIDGGVLRIVQKMEKSKNLYALLVDMN